MTISPGLYLATHERCDLQQLGKDSLKLKTQSWEIEMSPRVLTNVEYGGWTAVGFVLVLRNLHLVYDGPAQPRPWVLRNPYASIESLTIRRMLLRERDSKIGIEDFSNFRCCSKIPFHG